MEPKQDRKVALLPGVEEPHIRLPPENLEAEQALLGSILVNNAAYHRVGEFLKGEHFANALHGKLYDDIARLIEKGQVVSVITLKTYLEQDEAMKEAGGAEYLANLAAASVHVIDAEQYGRVIHDLYLRRQLIALGHDVVNGAFKPTLEESAMEQIETAEKQLYDLASVGQIEGGFKPFRASLTEAMVAAEAAYHRAGQLTGVATGLFQLDQLLGGLHKSDLIILAGRPAMGKSSLATNIGFNAARAYREEHDANGRAKAVDGAVVGFFSLEMSAEQLATRMISEQAEIPSEKIRKGELISADFDKVLSVANELEHLNFFIDDTPALSIAALRTRARRLKRMHGLGLLIVDYLQLLAPSGRTRQENRVQEVSEITRGLKTLAKELDVPVLALSQLSRAVEQREDKRPQLADLRESGSIEQDADVVMFIYRDEYYLMRDEPQRRAEESDQRFNERHDAWRQRCEQQYGKAEVIVAKQRHGPTGIVRLAFEGQFTKFGNLPADDDRSGAPAF
ncbi:replicative DNA helicase [Enhydrobacter sp.]|jgi:replicative DNA helicase|uniref:replicative DNA helicase n=1 Tax=Enhydrobacter sp. TaxID=1894999 RepID=UPI0026099FD9|nr:replicative DNA helicase [Enhydrobacter sp.]WIM13289.1 MAG: Replicative DNA helicase (DnaB) [Enhydrobacter sp.]